MQVRTLGTVAAVGVLLCSAVRASDLGTRTVSESADGMRLVLDIEAPEPVRSEIEVDGQAFTRLEFPGLRREGSPGAPELAVGTEQVGLPPGGSATLRVLESEIEDLGTMRIAPRPFAATEPSLARDGGPAGELLREDWRWDPGLYLADGPREEAVRLGAPGVLRHQRVVPLEIRPLLYDPATGRTRLVRRLRLEIALREGRGAEDEGDAMAARLATSRSWERIYGGALVNPTAAAGWRRAPARIPQLGGASKTGLLRPGLLGEEEWKLRVRSTGPVRVGAEVLRAAGFPDGTPEEQLRLYLRRFDAAHPLDPAVVEIPLQIVDTDHDGRFNGSDSFVFYGEHPRDDVTSEDTLARYSQENIYWLSVATSGSPARMQVLPRLEGTTTGPSVFRQRLAYEEDRVQNDYVFGSNSETVDGSELYFWSGLGVDRLGVTVAVPGRAASESLKVCVETQEDYFRRPFQLFVRTGSRDSVLLGSNPGTNPPDFQAPPRLTTCGVAAASQIDPGPARILLRPAPPETGVPFLDRVRLEYVATYTAEGNRIRCTNGAAAGRLGFPISGFSDPSLSAFEISDPKRPSSFDLAGAYAAGTLTLSDSVPAGTERVYLVLAAAAIPILNPGDIELDHPDDVLGELASAPVGTYDCLVVVHDSFADEPTLADWLAHRAAQGHRCRVVRTSDIYDACRGGLQHYEAIHRLAELAFTNWGIEFVVLIGDGSEDPVHLLPTSGPSFVPARLRYYRVAGSSGGDSAYRNDMNDKYYAQVAGGPNDMYPDLLLGRLPVGSKAELAAVLQKTIRYDTPQPGDTSAWRKRVFMFSDDEWVKRSVSGIPGNAHRRGCGELGFQTSVERASRTVDGAFPGDLRSVRFHLRDFSNQLFPRLPQHRGVPLDSTCWYAQGNGQAHSSEGIEVGFYQGAGPGTVGGALIDSVGAGVLFFALQSHANRAVVADEWVINNMEPPFAPAFRNDGKPFVFFGLGCHLNEYGPKGEDGSCITCGDALGERLLLVPSRGAVASYASTGFEYLGENNDFHERMWNIIFNKRYSLALGGQVVDSDTLAAHWLLSELLEIAEIRMGDPDMIARYVLLGDPMLPLDAGVPRVAVDRVDNGFLQSDNRLVVRDPRQPLGLQITLRDEQGIDSLWVVKRFSTGVEVPIDSVTVTAIVDTAAQIHAKRGYTVSFQLRVEECNLDVVVGARDLAGRRSEFVGRILFDQRLLANGLAVESGDRIDPRTAFRFEIHGCTPIPPPLPLAVYVDGNLLPPDQIGLRPDSVYVNWGAEFSLQLANGTHTLRFEYAGEPIATYVLDVGGFGMSEILAFPNPMRKQHDLMRIYFHLGEPIAGGHLRVLTPSGRTVLRLDLASPGVVKSDAAVPPGSIGSGVPQGDSQWNYVEIFPDGRDLTGDRIANGTYLYELRIRGTSGQEQRKRDKLVIMR